MYESCRNTDNHLQRPLLKKSKKKYKENISKRTLDLCHSTPSLLGELKRQRTRSVPKILEYSTKHLRSASSHSLRNPTNQIMTHRLSSKALVIRQMQDSPYKKKERNIQNIHRSNSTRKIHENRNTNRSPTMSPNSKKYQTAHLSSHERHLSGSKKKVKMSIVPTNRETREEEQEKINKNELYRKIFKNNCNSQLQTTSDRRPNQSSFEIEKADNLASVHRKKLEELKLKSNRKKR